MRLLLLLSVPFVLFGCPVSHASSAADASGLDAATSDAAHPLDAPLAQWNACVLHADCALELDGCCTPCDLPDLTDFDAINIAYRDEYRASVCPDPLPSCPPCAGPSNPALGATCASQVCTGFDVRALALSRCASDMDCRLRVTGCCACGGDTSPEALIAIRVDAEGAYQSLICDDFGCPECEPVYPDDVVAYCAEDGHCAVGRAL